MASSEPSSFLDRAQSFISENKRVILIGAAAALAVGGVAYYASSSSRPHAQPDVEKGTRKEKKKGKGNKKKKSVKDVDGPILEEIVPPKPKVESEDPLGVSPGMNSMVFLTMCS